MPNVPDLFAELSVRYLRDTYLPRIEQALPLLRADQLWQRPHEDSLSAGTILVHLEGNVRQWILSGLGGEPDARDRASEFERSGHADAEQLMTRLRTTVEEACRVVAGLQKAELKARTSIQGWEVSGLEAIYHIVEHFSWHTGQLVWIAKAHAGPEHGLSFYDEARVNAAHND